MHTHGARLSGLEDEAEPEKPSLMLLGACIAEFDPTRIRPLDANGQPVLNDLLHTDCGPYVQRVAAGSVQEATSTSSSARED
jgi:hypothetical protein